jgi:hypothetical protein
MTVIHFETESDNATLQEKIRAITQTLTRALVVGHSDCDSWSFPWYPHVKNGRDRWPSAIVSP